MKLINFYLLLSLCFILAFSEEVDDKNNKIKIGLVSTDGKCGPNHGNTVCPGNECCNKDGICGFDIENYCDAKICLENYGYCLPADHNGMCLQCMECMDCDEKPYIALVCPYNCYKKDEKDKVDKTDKIETIEIIDKKNNTGNMEKKNGTDNNESQPSGSIQSIKMMNIFLYSLLVFVIFYIMI